MELQRRSPAEGDPDDDELLDDELEDPWPVDDEDEEEDEEA